MEYRALKLKPGAELEGIDKISVVGKSHSALDVIDNDRLNVFSRVAAGRAVSYVTYRDVSAAERRKTLRAEHVVHKPGVLIGMKQPVVVDNYAAALLPAVLEREQPEIHVGRKVAGGVGIYSEHSAFFSYITHT